MGGRMADVTVKELADVVKTSTDSLLAQMKKQVFRKKAEDKVSEEQKQALLLHLKKNHGDADLSPQKITLKRKETSTLKTGVAGKNRGHRSAQKRTYVKRDELDNDADKTEVEDVAEVEVPIVAEAPVAAPVTAPAPAALWLQKRKKPLRPKRLPKRTAAPKVEAAQKTEARNGNDRRDDRRDDRKPAPARTGANPSAKPTSLALHPRYAALRWMRTQHKNVPRRKPLPLAKKKVARKAKRPIKTCGSAHR